MTAEQIEEARRLLAAATPGPWLFEPGCTADGDSCDLLVADPMTAPGCDPEYSQVLFDTPELGEAQVSANWELIPLLRNHATELLAAADAVRWRKWPEEKPEEDGWYVVWDARRSRWTIDEFLRHGDWADMSGSVVNWLPIPPAPEDAA